MTFTCESHAANLIIKCTKSTRVSPNFAIMTFFLWYFDFYLLIINGLLVDLSFAPFFGQFRGSGVSL